MTIYTKGLQSLFQSSASQRGRRLFHFSNPSFDLSSRKSERTPTIVPNRDTLFIGGHHADVALLTAFCVAPKKYLDKLRIDKIHTASFPCTAHPSFLAMIKSE